MSASLTHTDAHTHTHTLLTLRGGALTTPTHTHTDTDTDIETITIEVHIEESEDEEKSYSSLSRFCSSPLSSRVRLLLLHSSASASVASFLVRCGALLPKAKVALIVEITPDTTEEQIKAIINKENITRQQLILTIEAQFASTLAASHAAAHAAMRIAALDRIADAWYIGAAEQVVPLAGMTLRPLLFSPSISCCAPSGPLLLLLDRFDLTRVTLLVACGPSHSVRVIRAHWAALHRRRHFQANKAAQEEAVKAKITARERARTHTQMTGQSTEEKSNKETNTDETSADHHAATLGPSLFYRASLTPSTMYYRVSIHFSPSADSITALTAHGVLSDSLRSFLGLVGSSKCHLQLLDWDPSACVGVVSSSADLAVGVRAAFTLLGAHHTKTCRIQVHKQSLFLSAIGEAKQNE